MSCVYAHIRLDTNTIFYIGISKNNYRPYSKYCRNNYWNNIVKKCNDTFKVDILHNNITWEEACEKEKQYIKQYGRVNDSTGILCNLTDGGEGIPNLKHTLETKLKISIATKARYKVKSHCNMGKMLVNRNSRQVAIVNLKTYIIYRFNTLAETALFLNTRASQVRSACYLGRSIKDYYLKFGHEISNAEIKNLKKMKIIDISFRKDTKNYLARQKKVINIETNEIFESISEVAKRYGLINSTLNRKLNGICKNNTIFKLV